MWLKFAFEQLAQREGAWTPEALALVLLDGLEGTYRYLLGSVRRALQAGSPEEQRLWVVLHERLLPVLLVTQEALTVPQLAWLAAAPLDQVTLGVDLLASLFPCKPGGGDGLERVLPYHKSVLDWLGSETDAGAELVASKAQGHSLAAAACLGLAMRLQPWVLAAPGDAAVVNDGQQQQYALRHTVAHLVDASDDAGIEGLSLQFGFWQHAYAAGVGPGVLRDLLKHDTASPLVKDATRWLRTVSAFLVKFPQ